jgi:hypothetical protein
VTRRAFVETRPPGLVAAASGPARRRFWQPGGTEAGAAVHHPRTRPRRPALARCIPDGAGAAVYRSGGASWARTS